MQSFSDSIFAKVAGLKGVENIYTQHKPFVNRLIEDLVMVIGRGDGERSRGDGMERLKKSHGLGGMEKEI